MSHDYDDDGDAPSKQTVLSDNDEDVHWVKLFDKDTPFSVVEALAEQWTRGALVRLTEQLDADPDCKDMSPASRAALLRRAKPLILRETLKVYEGAYLRLQRPQ